MVKPAPSSMTTSIQPRWPMPLARHRSVEPLISRVSLSMKVPVMLLSLNHPVAGMALPAAVGTTLMADVQFISSPVAPDVTPRMVVPSAGTLGVPIRPS